MAVDPQSRNNILEGIRQLNQQGTLLSHTSHYMEEIEYICTRIVIMDKGKTLATGTKEELKAMINAGETVTVELFGLTPSALAHIQQMPHVINAHYDQDNKLTVQYAEGQHNLINLLNYLQAQGLTCGKIYSQQPTLNDVFLAITGKQLRD